MSDLSKNPHFVRYFNTWQKNPASIVFIPLAELYREQGLFVEAREVCLKGLEHHPRSIAGLLMLAQLEYDRELYAEARRLAGQVLSQIPGQREARALLSKIDAASTAEGLDEDPCSDTRSEERPSAVEAAPLFETCTMAQIYADQGEKRTALQIVKNILARDPANERARTLEEQWSGS